MARHVYAHNPLFAFVLFLLVWAVGCDDPPGPVQLGSYALDDMAGLIVGEDVVDIDSEISSDGGGSLHVYSEGKMIINLFEIPTKGFKGDTVIARSVMRSESLGGWTTMELWIFPKEGDPRRILKECKDIGRTRDWNDVEVVFPLLEGEVPETLRLAVILGGRGHIWIDDLQVISTWASDVGE